jgi:hypothetical protein
VSSPSIIRMIKPRRIRSAGHVALMGEKRNSYRILVKKPEEKRPLGRPRRRWEGNIVTCRPPVARQQIPNKQQLNYNNEERGFLRGPCRSVIGSTSLEFS